jgi:four helix bundle protein
MNSEDLKKRTKLFAISAIHFSKTLPKNDEGFVIKKQILRCATSVGANYRSACRARSTADFISKIAIVEEEADETCYWLEILEESGMLTKDTVAKIYDESCQLTAIFAASRKTSRMNSNKYK